MEVGSIDRREARISHSGLNRLVRGKETNPAMEPSPHRACAKSGKSRSSTVRYGQTEVPHFGSSMPAYGKNHIRT